MVSWRVVDERVVVDIGSTWSGGAAPTTNSSWNHTRYGVAVGSLVGSVDSSPSS